EVRGEDRFHPLPGQPCVVDAEAHAVPAQNKLRPLAVRSARWLYCRRPEAQPSPCPTIPPAMRDEPAVPSAPQDGRHTDARSLQPHAREESGGARAEASDT